MIEQLFKLTGETRDLEEMAQSFQEGPATVKKIDEFFYLNLEMESHKSDEQAISEGEFALERMNAICLVKDERFRTPRINGITRRDPVTGKIGPTIVYLQCHMQVRAGMRGTLTVTEADGTIRPRQPTFGEKVLNIALANEALRETLRTYGTVQHDWCGLYTVLETIEKGNGGKIPRAWATKREVDDFTSTACSYDAVGPGARHGFGAGQKMAPRVTLGQARALIRKLLRAWMDELIAQASIRSSQPGS